MSLDLISPEMPGWATERGDIAHVVNEASLRGLEADPVHANRVDSAGTAFVIRSLTEVSSRTYDVKFPELTARKIIPVMPAVDPGAELYAWQQFNYNTAAKVIDDYAADAPTSDVVVAEFSSRLFSLGTSYNYSYQDVRRARLAGVPLETRKALAARRAIENAVEQIAYFGIRSIPGGGSQSLKYAPVLSAQQKTPSAATDPLAAYGLTNFPNLSVQVGVNDWTNANTPLSAIMADWTKMQNQIFVTTKGIHRPDTVVFPLSLWAVLAQQPRSLTFTTDTLLNYMVGISPFIKNVFFSPMLETAGYKQDGVTVGPRIMMFERNEENIQLVIPMEFEQLPPQLINYNAKVPCHMRIGGVRVSYPGAFVAWDGASG